MNGKRAKQLRGIAKSLADAHGSRELKYEDKVVGRRSVVNLANPDKPFIIDCVTRRMVGGTRYWNQKVKKDCKKGLL